MYAIYSHSVIDVNLESLGDSISSAVIVEWQKKPGDSVTLDDVITVVETDKVGLQVFIFYPTLMKIR